MSEIGAPPPRWSAREILGLILALIGVVAVVTGASFYDARAGVITAGALVLLLGVLLGIG